MVSDDELEEESEDPSLLLPFGKLPFRA